MLREIVVEVVLHFIWRVKYLDIGKRVRPKQTNLKS